MFTLSPQGQAVAAFTLAILLVTGSINRLGVAVAVFFNGVFDTLSPQAASITVGLVTIAVGVVIFMAASRATANAPEGWTLWLAQGALPLAALGLLIALVNLLGALVDGRYGGYFFDAVG